MKEGTEGWHAVYPVYLIGMGEVAGRGLALSLYVFVMYCLSYYITCMYYFYNFQSIKNEKMVP